jgi:hypothetical protein
MLPTQGPTPFRALMGALNPFATEAGLKPDEVAQELSQSPDRLNHYVRRILTEGTDRNALVLFLDQMEELFTTHTTAAAKEFLRALYKAAQEGLLWVLATVRSDHLHHCHTHPEMLQVLRGPGHYPLGAIEPFMLKDLIAKPARYAGLNISDHLVRRIVHDTGIKEDDPARPGQSHLPLLAFVLNHLFEKRSNHELSEGTYNQVGGVTGAVAHHAAQVEADLHQTHRGKTNALLATLFESLIIVSTEGLPTRSRPLLAEFSPEMRGLIEVLVQKRLLRTEGQGEQATVSISHETLFEAWPLLKEYIDKNKKQLIDRTLLERRAKRWVERGRSWFDGLASGDDAKAYAKWLSQATDKRYRLPTESEWEYAARSGRKDEVWAGTSDEKELQDYAVYNTDRTEPVGSRKPNGLGLTDMSGNVWEWVEDCWHENYTGAPSDGSAWLESDAGVCGRRVVRGGSWLNGPGFLRASFRFRDIPDFRSGNIGFRLVQDIP